MTYERDEALRLLRDVDAGKPVHAHPGGEAHMALVRAGSSPSCAFVWPRTAADLINGLTPRSDVKKATGN
jgi:hypothetical protein